MIATKDDRNWAMFIHLGGLGNLTPIPFGSLVIPLVLWQIKKDEGRFIDEHGREAVNFQLTMLLYILISIPLCFVFVGFLTLAATVLLQLIGSIWASIRASNGQDVFYPMTFRFIG